MEYAFYVAIALALMLGVILYRHRKLTKTPSQLDSNTAIDKTGSYPDDDFMCIMFKDGTTHAISDGVTVVSKPIK